VVYSTHTFIEHIEPRTWYSSEWRYCYLTRHFNERFGLFCFGSRLLDHFLISAYNQNSFRYSSQYDRLRNCVLFDSPSMKSFLFSLKKFGNIILLLTYGRWSLFWSRFFIYFDDEKLDSVFWGIVIHWTIFVSCWCPVLLFFCCLLELRSFGGKYVWRSMALFSFEVLVVVVVTPTITYGTDVVLPRSK